MTVAVVTGAAHGGGRAISVALARQCDDIVLVGRSTRENPNPMLGGTLEATAQEVTKAGAVAHCLRADLARSEDRAAVVDFVRTQLGRCDVLVNNAAFNPIGAFLEKRFKAWAVAFEVNVTAAAYLAHALVPAMKSRRDGRIINIGSLAAATEVGVSQAAYAASKAALERFTVALAAELEGTGVAVNNIRVDEAIRTESLMKLVDGHERPPTSGYDPGEFGDTVAWLAQQPTALTGQVLTFADLRRLGALPATSSRKHSPG